MCIRDSLRVIRAVGALHGKAQLPQEHDAICDWVFDKDPEFTAFEEGTTKLELSLIHICAERP